MPVVVGRMDNRSSFMRDVFSNGVDRLVGQAKTILMAHLQQSQRLSVMDRDPMAEAKQEAQFKGATHAVKGADFLVTGDATELGRKEVGDHQLFGTLGRGKERIADAKATLNVVNSQTSEVV